MFAMKSFSCMPAVQTPEAPRDTRHLRIPGSRLPLGVIGSATPIDSDFGANTPFTFVPACKPPCLRFAVTVTEHHARLGSWLLARLYCGCHLRQLYFMRLQGATLTEPYVNLSIHTAPASLTLETSQSQADAKSNPAPPHHWVGCHLLRAGSSPSLQPHYRAFNTTTG